MAEAVAVRDNARTELAKFRNRLTIFREWASLGIPALLNIFDSNFGQGNPMPPANPRLLITC